MKIASRPVSIALGVWFIVFLLYSISPIQYVALSLEAYLLLSLSFMMFFLGYSLSIVGVTKNAVVVKRFGHRRIKLALFLLLVIMVVAIYFKFGIIAEVVGVQPLSFSSLSLIRKANLTGDLSLLGVKKIPELFILPLIFIVSLLLLDKKNRKKYKAAILMIILCLIFYQALSMSRGFFVYFFFTIIVLYFIRIPISGYVLYRGTKNRDGIAKKKLFLWIFAFIIIFQSMSFIRNSNGLDDVANYSSASMSFESWVPSIMTNNVLFLANIRILHYAVSGIYGFSVYTKDGMPEDEYHLGSHSFFGGVKLFTALYNAVERPFNYNYEVITEPTITNVYSFFREQLDDFGFFGVIIFHLVWGVVLGFSYSIYLRKGSYQSLVLPAILTIWYVYGVFIMQTVFVNSFLWPFVTYLLVGFIETKTK